MWRADVAPLFLSMCCIGALYCFERDTSRKLHVMARKLIYSVRTTAYRTDSSIWKISGTKKLGKFGFCKQYCWRWFMLPTVGMSRSLNGDCHCRACWPMYYRPRWLLMKLLRSEAETVKTVEDSLKSSPMSWEQWIQIEGFKRCIFRWQFLTF